MNKRSNQETGHSYLAIINGRKDNSSYTELPLPESVDPLVIQILQIIFREDLLIASSGIFLSGRVYEKEENEQGQVVYTGISTWREEISQILASVAVPLHGLEMELHEQDTAAGAGCATSRLLMCPLSIAECRSRFGDATGEELKLAKLLGHRVGLLLTPEQHDEAYQYLTNGGKAPPSFLPPYWMALTTQPQDLIRGTNDILRWVAWSREKQDVPELLGRAVPKFYLSLVFHYIATALAQRPQDLEIFEQILKKPLF